MEEGCCSASILPRLIALDMDGTLLNSHKKISNENRKAIEFWKAKGAHIVLASGRMTPVLEENVKELNVDCFLMGYNGGECVSPLSENRSRIFHQPLPDGLVDRLIDYAQTQKLFLNVYLDGKLRGAPTPETKKYPERYAYLNQATYEYVESLDSLRGTNPTKCLFIKHEESERDEIYQQIEKSKEFTDAHYTKTHSYNPEVSQVYMEFMHPTVNKGTGLKKLCSHLNISTESVISFGDANNDLELLATAGTGVCMAQGSPEAKAAARYVSKFTNDEHAVGRELMNLARKHFPEEF